MNKIKNTFNGLLYYLCTLCVTGYAHAVIITYNYEAVITSAPSLNLFTSPGTVVKGSFSLDTSQSSSIIAFGIFREGPGSGTAYRDITFSNGGLIPQSMFTGELRTIFNPTFPEADSTYTPSTYDPYIGNSFAQNRKIRNNVPGEGNDSWEMELFRFDRQNSFNSSLGAIVGWRLIDPTGTAFGNDTPHPLAGYYPVLSLDMFETATLSINMTTLSQYSGWGAKGYATTGSGFFPHEAQITSLTTSVDGVLISSVPLPGALGLMLLGISGLGGSLLFDRRRRNSKHV